MLTRTTAFLETQFSKCAFAKMRVWPYALKPRPDAFTPAAPGKNILITNLGPR